MNLLPSRNQPRARYLGSLPQPIKISFQHATTNRSKNSDGENPAATPPSSLAVPFILRRHPSSCYFSYILPPFPASFSPSPPNTAHPNIPSPLTASDCMALRRLHLSYKPITLRFRRPNENMINQKETNCK